MTITTIIPNYNGSNLIKKNLPKVISVMEKYNSAIIIVDDHSVESDYMQVKEIVESLKNEKLPITLIRNKRNYGFSKTVNTGARMTDSDLLFFLNSDVIPEKNFLDPVISKFKENETLFAVGCMDKSIENGKVILRGRGLGKFERGFLVHSKGETTKSNTLWVSGGSGVMRNSIFKKLGGFDEVYNPFYWEDIDLSYRALKSGYTIVFDNSSVVEHRHEEGAIKNNFSAQRIKTIAYRNQIIFVWKTITDSSLLFQHIIYLPYYIFRSLIHRDTAFIVGLSKAIAMLPITIHQRNLSKKLFVKRDQEVLAEFV